MAEKINFTVKRIKAIKPPESGKTYYRDTGCKSLELCVTEAGSKTYYFYGRISGRPQRVRLGTVEDITLDDARQAIATMRGEMALGRDPALERRQRKQERTLRNVFEDWLEVHAKPRKKTWQDDQRLFDKYLEPFHKTRISQLTAAKIAKWHVKVGTDCGHYQANRVKSLLSTILNYAVKLGMLTTNPARSVTSFPEQSRDRFLLPSEMTAFFTAIKTMGEPWTDFFALALFTGARRGNVQSMRWDELDFDRMTWTIPAAKSKNGRPMIVPLSPPALLILKSRAAVATKSPFVFASHSQCGHLVEVKTAWQRIRTESGLLDLRMHDLRRSLGSWQATAGASLAIIGQSLGHASLQSTATYARLQLDTVRQSVDAAGLAMQKAAGLIEEKTIDVEVKKDE